MEEVLSWKEEEKSPKRKTGRPWVYQARGQEFYSLDHDQFPLKIDCLVELNLENGNVFLQDSDAPQSSNPVLEDLMGEGTRGDGILLLSKKWSGQKRKRDAEEGRVRRSKCCGGKE